MTTVDVVVPYFRAQPRLDLVLAALELQTVPTEGLHVLVADDGSPEPPEVGERPYRVTVVRQPDLGIRPAAARNLGVAAGDGDVLVFLDGDTVPEPGYLAAMRDAVVGTRTLAVGRRRHADLTGWTPARVRGWLTGDGPGPAVLDEPRWLSEAYARTDDLRTVGDDGYRFVIAAVLACTRELLAGIGGWEDEIVCYGGEDWELAHRAWLAGADLLHVPAAVAWHDGPDFGGREVDRVALKNVESSVVSHFLTHPAARDRGLLYARPAIVVELDDRHRADADVAVAVASLLAGTDAAVWLREGGAAGPRGPLAGDPRVHVGAVPAALAARATHRVEVAAPVRLDGVTLRELCARAPVALGGLLTVRRTRDLARGHPHAPTSEETCVTPVAGVVLEQEWGRAARAESATGHT